MANHYRLFAHNLINQLISSFNVLDMIVKRQTYGALSGSGWSHYTRRDKLQFTVSGGGLTE